jgi:integrase/recombinase XerD
MLSIVPYYKKERKSVIVRVILNGSVAKVIQTGIKIESNQWSKGKIINHPNKSLLNAKVSSVVHELQAVITKAELLGVVLTKDRLKRLVESGEITTDFYKHCKVWIEEKYSNIDTRRVMMSDLEKAHTFAPTLQFGDIDKRWLIRYENYMREVLGNNGNTVWRSMKFIRTMLYDAQDTLGKQQIHNPFDEKEYTIPSYTDPEKDGLTIEELDKIEELLTQPVPTILKIVSAKFLLMCYTGLRISDAKRFTNEHIIDGRIVITSKKTGTTTRLKIHNRLQRILTALTELPEKSFADQSFNEWLKVVADTTEITRMNLSSHTARHTFGCILAESGVSQEEAMELMGVKDKGVLRVYYQLRQPQIDTAAEKLNSLHAKKSKDNAV